MAVSDENGYVTDDDGIANGDNATGTRGGRVANEDNVATTQVVVLQRATSTTSFPVAQRGAP